MCERSAWRRIRARWRRRWFIARSSSRLSIPGWVAPATFVSLIWPVYAMFAYRWPMSLWNFVPLLFLPVVSLRLFINNYRAASKKQRYFIQEFEQEAIDAKKLNLKARRLNAKEIKSIWSFIWMVIVAPLVFPWLGAARYLSKTRGNNYNPKVLTVIMALCAIFPIGMYIYIRYAGKRDESIPAHACPNCGYDLRSTPDHCPECGFKYH